MKKTIICHQIKYAFHKGVYSVNNNSIELYPGFELKMLEIEKGEITESMKTSSAGERVFQNLKVIGGNASEILQSMHERMILLVSLENGEERTFGTKNNPAFIKAIEGDSPAVSLTFESSSKTFQFQD